MVRRQPHAPEDLKHRSRRGDGFSLIEVLVGVILTGLMLVAGVRALLALIQEDSANQLELNRKDAVGRVFGLMQDEIRNAQRLDSGSIASPLTGIDSTNCPTAAVRTVLILRGPTASEDISYGLQVRADSAWRGPAVLVRCGFPYREDGSLNTAAGRSEQVVLDNLQTDGFTVFTPGGAGAISRSLELTLISNAAGTPVRSTQQVPINSTQVYDLASSTAGSGSGSTASSCRTGCASGTSVQWTPEAGDTVEGNYNLEDVIYFTGNRSDFEISGVGSGNRCINASTADSPAGNCRVRRGSGAWTVINYGDVLVFSDSEIRIPNNPGIF